MKLLDYNGSRSSRHPQKTDAASQSKTPNARTNPRERKTKLNAIHLIDVMLAINDGMNKGNQSAISAD